VEERREPGGGLASAAGAAFGIGSAATAAAVAACCSGPALGPLIVAMLGAGGAVALEGVRPYAVLLLAVSALAIGVSFWFSARGARRCTPRRSPIEVASRSLLWLSALVWIGALTALLWARFA
jgi:hypothetical protein